VSFCIAVRATHPISSHLISDSGFDSRAGTLCFVVILLLMLKSYIPPRRGVRGCEVVGGSRGIVDVVAVSLTILFIPTLQWISRECDCMGNWAVNSLFSLDAWGRRDIFGTRALGDCDIASRLSSGV
jgi:hypothetical protein